MSKRGGPNIFGPKAWFIFNETKSYEEFADLRFKFGTVTNTATPEYVINFEFV